MLGFGLVEVSLEYGVVSQMIDSPTARRTMNSERP